MKVALVAHRLAHPNATGVGRYVRELTTALAERDDVDVSVCAPSERDAVDWLPPNVRRVEFKGDRRLLQLSWMVAGRPRVDDALGAVDVVHVLLPFFPVPTAHRAVVYTVNDLMPFNHPDWYRAVERAGFARSVRKAVDGPAVIVPSQFVADELSDRFRLPVARVRVVPDAAPSDFAARPFQPIDAARPYLIAIGSVSERKNLAVVLRALATMGVHRPDLVAIGPDGAGAPAIRELTQQLGLSSNVQFLGHRPDEELLGWLRGALALVHPSRDEGFGLTPLEAMSVGTPVIASAAASLPEVVGDAGIIVDPDGVAAWADAIDRIVSDDHERARLRDLGSAQVARFSWARTAAETVAVYRDVVATRADR